MSHMIAHPLRQSSANELHARPFPTVAAPARAAFFAYKCADDEAGRNEVADRAHLWRLLDMYDVAHPDGEATHFFGQLGSVWVKWECHTEFVTYTAILDDLGNVPFDGSEFDIFPAEWLADLPGLTLSSTSLRIEPDLETESIKGKLSDWFVSESLAVSRVLDNAAVIAGDYRMDGNGH